MKECSHASVFFFKCSASCGTGAQRREVKCLNSEQTAAHDCRQEERPIIRHACNDRACNEGPFSLHRNPFRLISLLEILPLPQSWKSISIICWRSVWLTSWLMLLCVGFDIQSPMNLRGRCRTRRISPNRRTTKRTTEPRVTTTSMMSPRHLAVMNLTWWNILLVRYPPSKLKTLTLPLILLSTVVIIFFVGMFTDEKCVDNFKNCHLVLQARLCKLKYYLVSCCASCSKSRTWGGATAIRFNCANHRIRWTFSWTFRIQHTNKFFKKWTKKK